MRLIFESKRFTFTMEKCDVYLMAALFSKTDISLIDNIPQAWHSHALHRAVLSVHRSFPSHYQV